MDADKGTITVTVNDKDQTFTVGADTKLLGPGGKDLKNGIKNKGLAADREVTITTDKDAVKQIQLKKKDS